MHMSRRHAETKLKGKSILQQLLQGGSESFRRLNTDLVRSICTSQSKSVAGERVEETRPRPCLDAGYFLCHVDITFCAEHGQLLDKDNRNYVGKPILDAIVDLGLAPEDSKIETHVDQRVDSAPPSL